MKTSKRTNIWRVGGFIVIAVLLALSSAAPAVHAADGYIRVEVTDIEVTLERTASSYVYVTLSNVDTGVQGVQIHLKFNTNTNPDNTEIVSVVDANSNMSGVQVELHPQNLFGGATYEGQNRVFNDVPGDIYIAVAQLNGDPVIDTNGPVLLATITWFGEREGHTDVTFESDTLFSDANGTGRGPDEIMNAQVGVVAPGRVRGCVHPQGRTNHSGVLVTAMLVDPHSNEDYTDANGCFDIITWEGEDYYVVTANMHGYLSSETTVHIPDKGIVFPDPAWTKLWGGDVTDDDKIDIRDVAYIAFRFGRGDSQALPADVTGDGIVNILDLTLAATNFGKQGPTLWDDKDNPSCDCQ